CGRETQRFIGYDEWITIRHLPILGRKVYLKIRPRRTQCLECDNEPTTTERYPWRVPGKSYTNDAVKRLDVHELQDKTLFDKDYEILMSMLEVLVTLNEVVRQKDISIKRLLKRIFGIKRE
ncbi:transposase family protein, partial [Desulfobacter sp.]|uniref:transposase family protein n=1 Tax=Desulfobacter sp. TaxID=2294 RepID=UPI003D12D453